MTEKEPVRLTLAKENHTERTLFGVLHEISAAGVWLDVVGHDIGSEEINPSKQPGRRFFPMYRVSEITPLAVLGLKLPV
jgi:hypothetical protein